MESNIIHGSIPLISCDKVSMPKCERGLGIKKIKDVNVGHLAKLGCKVIIDPHNVWVEVVFC